MTAKISQGKTEMKTIVKMDAKLSTMVLPIVYSENLVMLNFFFWSVSIWLLMAHWQHPMMDCCPFWASVALAIQTTKQLKTHVAVVKMSKYITHMRRHVLKFYWDMWKANYIENHSFCRHLRHNNSCMNSKHSKIVSVDNEYII